MTEHLRVVHNCHDGSGCSDTTPVRYGARHLAPSVEIRCRGHSLEMGRRTLLAIARADGTFDCRYAHWGVTAGRSRPLGSEWLPAAVLDVLDAGFDQLLVRDGVTRRYCVCWLDPRLRDHDDIALARTNDPDTLRAWWTRRKSRAADAVADGAPSDRVRAALLAGLRHRATAVHLTDDASFLRGDR